MQNGDEMAETAAKKGGFIELDPNLLKDNTKSLFDIFAQVEYDAEEQSKESLISLSWHLTRSEKNYIREAVHEPVFESELRRLQELLQ